MTDTAVSAPSRSIVTEIPGPKSRELLERKAAAVPQGIPHQLPVFIAEAHDAIITDVDGNRFIDLGCGIGVTTIGHTNDAVVAAVRDQVGKLTHSLFGTTPYEPYVRVAEYLAKHTPGAFEKKTFFVNSGSEAVENGVKIARKFTGRRAVAVVEHGYHGRTNLTMTMNFKPAPYATGMGPLASDIFHAPGSYPLHDGLDGAEAAERTQYYLEKHVGVSDLACLVIEPIQGEGGFIVPADGYLPAMQEWCTANGVVMIADEVQSGICRTGATFASELFGWEPDMVLSAKGIAGGMPLAGVTGRAEIMDSVHVGGIGGTFGGNPVSCAAAVAIFEQIERDDLNAQAQRIERVMRPLLDGLAEKHEEIIEVRGRGAMLAIEFIDPATGAPIMTAPIAAAAGQDGVLVLTAGTDYNVLRFLPSLAITDDQLREAVDVIDRAIAQVKSAS
ncbi:aminotransferase class III-fold pyridoxal phosphate-dependent enzyme [Agrococcus sp. HG114]|uniref:aminotransferase class III-fold pyridoxal phosphate-dependent enzyme n=1 Tax=Agrococcus sp. HG114 TaxID=2969757 RepID=UPI00215A3E4B|nr:aminotransferase class III-fold pyridoxal phosphate-dependent enzyme [Agrococcus sp. HG114]MCR8671321.1 aminotransferase class III-fold pyridoxal phosphate-dependent enzyme [Agrococcus sp. HG114]